MKNPNLYLSRLLMILGGVNFGLAASSRSPASAPGSASSSTPRNNMPSPFAKTNPAVYLEAAEILFDCDLNSCFGCCGAIASAYNKIEVRTNREMKYESHPLPFRVMFKPKREDWPENSGVWDIPEYFMEFTGAETRRQWVRLTQRHIRERRLLALLLCHEMSLDAQENK
jgi:hypothetical protein